jgi:hypothetical protein
VVDLIQKKAIDEIDYVRMEIALALKEKKLVVPVRILGAPKPEEHEIHYLVRPMLKNHVHVLNDPNGDRAEIEAMLDAIDLTYADRDDLWKRKRRN